MCERGIFFTPKQVFGAHLDLRTLCSNLWPLALKSLVQATDSDLEVSLLNLGDN